MSSEIPPKCACGCGRSVSKAKFTKASQGIKAGDWRRYTNGHNGAIRVREDGGVCKEGHRRTLRSNGSIPCPTCRRARKMAKLLGVTRREILDHPPPECCEICGYSPSPSKRAELEAEGKMWLAFDHDHEGGIFRGWLCRNCNIGLGQFKDDPKLFKAAYRYLKKDRSS